jgi:hypothetical protein
MFTYDFTYSLDITADDYEELIDQKHYNFLMRWNLWHDEDMPILRTAELRSWRNEDEFWFVHEIWSMDVSEAYVMENRAKKTAYYASLGMLGY